MKDKEELFALQEGNERKNFGENKAKRTRTVTSVRSSDVPVLKAVNPTGEGILHSPKIWNLL